MYKDKINNMKEIIKSIFGEEAAKDEDIVSLYEGANKEMCLDLIEFTLQKIMVEGKPWSTEEILENFNNELL